MSEWTTLTLAEICAASGGGIQTGPFGSQLHASDYVAEGTPSVMPQNIGDNRISTESIARINDADLARLAKYTLRAGDIVYSRRGDVERRALVREENAGWLCGTGCLRVRIQDQLVHDSRFISFALGLAESREWIVRHAVGATMLNLNTGILGGVPLRVPGVGQQQAIAEVLSALDDKIAANVEAMRLADELVRSKYEALAGDPVPLGSIALNVRDQVDPKGIAAETPYVGLEHVPRRSMWMSNFETAAKVSSAKASFREGDVLFGKLRPYFHKVVSATFSGIASTDILVVRAIRPELRGLVLAAASSDGAIAATTASSEGTRMPRTKWADLGAIELPWPGEEQARAFSSEVVDLAAWAAATSKESQALATTRDELLPLLMSGNVRVKDAEKTVEGVL